MEGGKRGGKGNQGSFSFSFNLLKGEGRGRFFKKSIMGGAVGFTNSILVKLN